MTTSLDIHYIQTDPFPGDESDISCRNVALRKARKAHVCYGLGGKQDHSILPGERYRYETALVDGRWGEYKICLQCMDKFISGEVADG